MKLTETRCFDCDRGLVRPVVTQRSFTVDGRRIRVPGLVVLVCNHCGERSWPDEELVRGRTLAAIKHKAVAAA